MLDFFRSKKHQWADTLQNRKVDGVIQKLLERSSDGKAPSRDDLLKLHRAWANEGYSANLDYLEAVTAAGAETSGPILECGSGLTSLVMAIVAGRRGVNVVSLEHISAWRDRVAATLQRNSLPGQVVLAPLKEYPSFAWYERRPEIPSGIRLVVCDGPPGTTRGGRYGLMSVADLLADNVQVLLDDAGRPDEQKILTRWQEEFHFSVEVFPKPSGTFARASRAAAKEN